MHQHANQNVYEEMKMVHDNTQKGNPMVVGEAIESHIEDDDLPHMNDNDGHASKQTNSGSTLMVNQSEHSKHLFQQTDIAKTRQQQFDQMKVEDSQSNVCSWRMNKTMQEIQKRMKHRKECV